MLKTEDIMTRQVICVNRDAPIFEAIELMVKNKITGMPVVENDMVLVGVLSEQDVLRLLGTFEEEKDRTVNDFMTQPAIHYEQGESIMDICSCFRDSPIRRVPITSNSKIVGIISRSDILKFILGKWSGNAIKVS